MAHLAPHARYSLRTFSQHTPSPPSPWGILTSITPSQIHFVNSPPKTSQSQAPTLTGPLTSATLYSTSLVFSPSFHLTPLPAPVSLTSNLPTRLQLTSFKTGRPRFPLPGPTMFPSRYCFRHPYFDHLHQPPTGTKLPGTLLRHHLPPLDSP